MKTPINLPMMIELAPKSVKDRIDQAFVDKINAAINDPEACEYIRDSMITAKEVAQSGKYSFEQYVSACKYATFKNMGETNINSFIKTFPDKYQNWLVSGKSDKEISRYVAAYNASKCVEEVIDKVKASFYIQNMDLRQKALMVQVDLMQNSKSDMVRSQAANSVLANTAPPENANKMEVNIGISDEVSVISDLRSAVAAMVEAQKAQIASGAATAQDVAHSRIIEGEVEDVDDDEY